MPTHRAPFTKMEQEAIILFAVWEMIDEMVNFEIFEKPAKFENTNLWVKSATHQRLFNILLGDFLSLPQKGKTEKALPFDLAGPPENARRSDNTFLLYLRRICDEPKLNSDAGVIRRPLDNFANWLDEECVIEDVWFSAISTEINIKVPRIKFLKICGDIAKHNFARLQTNVSKIRDILEANGKTIDEGQGFQILPEFYEWFHTHLFAYHASTIAEFLNQLRWGIFNYLKPEFERSFELRDPEPSYGYHYPIDCNQLLPRGMYWDLMNKVRRKPFFPQFTVTQSLKEQF
jgi:hypothetical protein